MYDDGDCGPDEIDKQFDELDQTVDFARDSMARAGNPNQKYDTSIATIGFMIEEVPIEDIRIYQQLGDSWVAEVKYRGVNFIAIAGKNIPESWKEILAEIDDEDDDDDDDD